MENLSPHFLDSVVTIKVPRFTSKAAESCQSKAFFVMSMSAVLPRNRAGKSIPGGGMPCDVTYGFRIPTFAKYYSFCSCLKYLRGGVVFFALLRKVGLCLACSRCNIDVAGNIALYSVLCLFF